MTHIQVWGVQDQVMILQPCTLRGSWVVMRCVPIIVTSHWSHTVKEFIQQNISFVSWVIALWVIWSQYPLVKDVYVEVVKNFLQNNLLIVLLRNNIDAWFLYTIKIMNTHSTYSSSMYGTLIITQSSVFQNTHTHTHTHTHTRVCMHAHTCAQTIKLYLQNLLKY